MDCPQWTHRHSACLFTITMPKRDSAARALDTPQAIRQDLQSCGDGTAPAGFMVLRLNPVSRIVGDGARHD
jgi:hypothetical protein